MHLDLAIATHVVRAHDKFLARSGRKFFFKAMRLDEVGATLDFNAKLALRRHLEELKAAHTTGVVLTEAQAHSALDIVAASGMVAIVELSVAHDELLAPGQFSSMVSRLAHTANIYRSHTGLLGYLMDCSAGNGERQQSVASSELKRIQRRLRALLRTLKQHDQNALVAIKHRGGASHVLAEEDFVYSELTPQAAVDLKTLVARLHDQAGARPMIVEFSQASPEQDKSVALAFGAGAAGVVARPVPAPAAHDWLGIRILRAAEKMPFMALNGACPPQAERTPMVSVIVSARNSERTVAQCLESIGRLAYPKFEVIVVDDGSTDGTAAVAARFPQVRLIRQTHHGLNAARNAALKVASGEIVAFTDAESIVDPHWLTFIVRTIEEDRCDACCGPSDASPASSIAAACVGAVQDSGRDGIAGSNLAFTRDALSRVGGFDSRFVAAGGETDVYRRMVEAGLELGHNPAAIVWRAQPGTVGGYFAHQAGQGSAEAILQRRHRDRGKTRLGALPQTLEWLLFWTIAAALSARTGISIFPALAMIAIGPALAIYGALRSPLPRAYRGVASRVLIAFLAYAGPICREAARCWTLIRGGGRVRPSFTATAAEDEVVSAHKWRHAAH